MFLDERNEFADAVTVNAAAGTALIGNQINSVVVRDLGQGQPVYLAILTAVEIITGGSAGTLLFQLASDSSAAIATDGSATVHLQTDELVTDGTDANAAQFKLGGVIYFGALPAEGVPYEQYLGILAVVASTTVTVGSINAFLTLDPHGWKSYPDANN